MSIFNFLKPKKEDSNNNNFKIGDWVYSYSKGIFRIEKIIDEYFDESEKSILGDNKIGDKKEYRTIISKRCLNSNFKKSISYESCSEFYISKINDKDLIQLNEIIEKNQKYLIELDNYEIPTQTSIYNMELDIEKDDDLKKVHDLIDFIKSGQSFLEIENEMEKLDIKKLIPKHFGNYKFQLLNFDNEYQNGNVVKNSWCFSQK